MFNFFKDAQEQIADLKHENEILKLTHAAELKEKDILMKKIMKEREMLMKEREMLINDEKHQNEIIKLKLEFAEFRLQSKQ